MRSHREDREYKSQLKGFSCAGLRMVFLHEFRSRFQPALQKLRTRRSWRHESGGAISWRRTVSSPRPIVNPRFIAIVIIHLVLLRCSVVFPMHPSPGASVKNSVLLSKPCVSNPDHGSRLYFITPPDLLPGCCRGVGRSVAWLC